MGFGCWHKWTKWTSDFDQMLHAEFVNIFGGESVGIFQIRTCEKCGLMQKKRLA